MLLVCSLEADLMGPCVSQAVAGPIAGLGELLAECYTRLERGTK